MSNAQQSTHLTLEQRAANNHYSGFSIISVDGFTIPSPAQVVQAVRRILGTKKECPMPDKRDVILQEMSKIYTMFCLPRITLNIDTRETKIEYIWQNDEARQTFENLGEILKIENVALLEQKYAEHRAHLTLGDSAAN